MFAAMASQVGMLGPSRQRRINWRRFGNWLKRNIWDPVEPSKIHTIDHISLAPPRMPISIGAQAAISAPGRLAM